MGRRRRRVVGLVIVGAVCLGLLAYVLSLARSPVGHGSPPLATATPSASADPFSKVDYGLQRLVDEKATWQTPTSLNVGRSHRIGLVIGDSGRLRTQIDDLVEAAVPQEAGTVKVGPTVRVSLWADDGDAVVKPAEAVDQSTGSQIAMLWTWFVRPLHPSDQMFFIAHVEVPSDEYTFSTDIPLTLSVERTVSYTGQQIFTHWATWSAIVIAVASGVRWLWTRRRGKQATPADDTDEEPTNQDLGRGRVPRRRRAGPAQRRSRP